MSGIADKSRELRAFAPALILLAICALINYVDRGNLSIAAPLLKDELRISASQLGILLSAFFWTYTAMQFVSGWMVDSFDANRVMAAGFLLWSLFSWIEPESFWPHSRVTNPTDEPITSGLPVLNLQKPIRA